MSSPFACFLPPVLGFVVSMVFFTLFRALLYRFVFLNACMNVGQFYFSPTFSDPEIEYIVQIGLIKVAYSEGVSKLWLVAPEFRMKWMMVAD